MEKRLARTHRLHTHILEVILHPPLQLTLCVLWDWKNECYDNDIGRLEQCKENEVCYYKKWSFGSISSSGSFEERRCEPRENHRINFCGRDDFWMNDEVYDRAQLPGRPFSPSDKCKKLFHHFLLHFSSGGTVFCIFHLG